MELMKQDVENILHKIIQKLAAPPHSTVRKIMLYGSYARGDFTKNSDIDIMVLVDDENPYKPYSTIKSEVDMLSDQYLVMISCHFQNYQHFYNAMNSTSFYKNIEKEGVVYYDAAV